MIASTQVLLSCLVISSMSPSALPEDERVPQKVALIVAIVDEGDSIEDRTQHLMKYEFVAGELAATDVIVSNPGGQLRFNREKSQLYQDRYVITDFGDIVDITAGQFVHRGGWGTAYTRLLGIEGDHVVIHTPLTEAYHYYDLAEQAYHELENRGKWLLPGLLSPDGTTSVSSSYLDEGRLWLHFVDGDMKLLGDGFYVEYSVLASTIGGVPFLWLDNERILTQTSNGEIVILTVNGSIEPVVSVDLSPFESDISWLSGALYVLLSMDTDGNIIYAISLLSPDARFCEYRFLIDVENGSYSAYDPEWTTLGHMFEYSLQKDTAVIRYDGNDIGQTPYFSTEHTQTMKGHIAIAIPETPSANPTAISVWSSANEAWTTIEFEPPIWMTHTAIIGWLDPDAKEDISSEPLPTDI